MKLMKRLAASVVVAFGCVAPLHAAVLLHAYDFSAGVVDSVGGQNGSLLNGATTVGGALVLDGVNDYVQFASSIVPTIGSMSVAFWAREDARSGAFVEFISQGSSGGPGFYIGHNPGGMVRVTDLAASTGVATGALADWVHYVMTVDVAGSSTHLFMDSVEVWSTSTAFQTGAGGTATRLGRQLGGFSEFFHGAMDDLAVYSGALSAAEVESLYRGTASGVPEPGSLALAVLALLAMARVARPRP